MNSDLGKHCRIWDLWTRDKVSKITNPLEISMGPEDYRLRIRSTESCWFRQLVILDSRQERGANPVTTCMQLIVDPYTAIITYIVIGAPPQPWTYCRLHNSCIARYVGIAGARLGYFWAQLIITEYLPGHTGYISAPTHEDRINPHIRLTPSVPLLVVS